MTEDSLAIEGAFRGITEQGLPNPFCPGCEGAEKFCALDFLHAGFRKNVSMTEGVSKTI